MIILLAHFFGCGFHYLARIELENNGTNNWLVSKEIHESSWSIRYLDSFYFAIVTAVTVGYGK